MSRFTRKVIEKIRRDGIEPEAGWKFAFKRSLLWIGIVITGGVAALSLSMMALSVLAIDRSPFTIAPERLFTFAFFRSLPFLWIGLFVAFSALAIFEFRNTRHGYRHRIAVVAALSGIVIIVGATILSAWGADELAERMMRERFPRYMRMTEMRETFWSNPEDGFLAGTIRRSDSGNISVVDRSGSEWNIRIGKKTTVRPLVRLEKGESVRMIGKKRNDRIFEAEDIRPWEGQRPGMRMEKRFGPDPAMNRE